MLFVYLISVFGIAHFIKESDIMSKPRIWCIKIHPIFMRLLECYFCLGFWVSLMVYLITFSSYRPIDHALFAFGGATISLVMSSLIYTFQNVGGK